jgi:nucleoside-diphosphate-sugar epimerase
MMGPPFVYTPAGCKFTQWLRESHKGRQFVGLKRDERRSFVYVQDVVRCILAIAQKHQPLAERVEKKMKEKEKDLNERDKERYVKDEEKDNGKSPSQKQNTLSLLQTSKHHRDNINIPHVGRVFNVGGPKGLSRLDLAAMLCCAFDTELVVYRMSNLKVMMFFLIFFLRSLFGSYLIHTFATHSRALSAEPTG